MRGLRMSLGVPFETQTPSVQTPHHTEPIHTGMYVHISIIYIYIYRCVERDGREASYEEEEREERGGARTLADQSPVDTACACMQALKIIRNSSSSSP